MNNTPLSEVSEALEKALAESKKAEAALEAARATLMPLEESAREKRNAIHALMNQYASLTGMPTATPARGRGRKAKDPNAPTRTYNIDPAKKVETQFKRSFTRAINAGKEAAEALKEANAAASGLASTLSVPFAAKKKAPGK